MRQVATAVAVEATVAMELAAAEKAAEVAPAAPTARKTGQRSRCQQGLVILVLETLRVPSSIPFWTVMTRRLILNDMTVICSWFTFSFSVQVLAVFMRKHIYLFENPLIICSVRSQHSRLGSRTRYGTAECYLILQLDIYADLQLYSTIVLRSTDYITGMQLPACTLQVTGVREKQKRRKTIIYIR